MTPWTWFAGDIGEDTYSLAVEPTGYGTRANVETCLLGMIGDLGLPLDRSVRRLIIEPIREHSRKPDRVPRDIDRLYAGPAAELFARTRRPGWDSWGNQVEKFAGAA